MLKHRKPTTIKKYYNPSTLSKCTSQQIHPNNKKNKKMATLSHHSKANTIDSPNGEELYPTVRDNIPKSKPAVENTLQSHGFQQKKTPIIQ